MFSQFVPPVPTPLCPHVHLYVCLSIPALQIDLSILFFSRLHTYALIYSVFLFPTSVCRTDSRSVHITTNDPVYFHFMTNIPLYVCTTSSLSIHLSVDV